MSEQSKGPSLSSPYGGRAQDGADFIQVTEALARSEARLQAARELVGLAVYAWDPQTNRLEWDEGLRALWGLHPGQAVDTSVFEAGIHPDDRPRVAAAIAACVDPAGSGAYSVEYRVIGRDGIERWVATAGRTTFDMGNPVDFIGAAIDISERKRSEAVIRESEARFRSFAEHSTNLLWIADPRTGEIEYRSPAYEQIWGEPRGDATTRLDEWLGYVHSDDAERVRRVLDSVGNGEIAQIEYRITRPGDGEMRWLRDTSFPICEAGKVIKIAGITEDLTRHDGKQVYLVGASPMEERRIAQLVRGLSLRLRAFATADAFLDIAPFLAPGCVLVDHRQPKRGLASVPIELRARSIPLKVIVIGSNEGDVSTAVETMKMGVADYLQPPVSDDAIKAALAAITTDRRGRPEQADTDEAMARIARLSGREREVMNGLVEGGTNKTIALQLGISPRTVELHRGQIMAKLAARNLAELLQLALLSGLRPSRRH